MDTMCQIPTYITRVALGTEKVCYRVVTMFGVLTLYGLGLLSWCRLGRVEFQNLFRRSPWRLNVHFS